MSDFLDFLLKTRPRASSIEIQQAGGDAAGPSNGPTLSSSLIYPSDLFTPGTESYILFFVRDSVAKGAQIIQKMALYMPPTVKVEYGAQYQELEMTILQYNAIGTSLQQAWAPNNPFPFEVSKRDSLYNGAKAVGGAVDSILSTEFGKEADQYFGKSVNPHMALLFKGMDFRSFSFDFQLMARNAEESASIQRIIATFKEAMHPDVESEADRYWQFPDNFEIALFSPTNNYLFQISTCVLASMEVDYAGSGVPSFFNATGAPVDIRLSLNFKELEVMTKKRIRQGY